MGECEYFFNPIRISGLQKGAAEAYGGEGDIVENRKWGMDDVSGMKEMAEWMLRGVVVVVQGDEASTKMMMC